MSLRRRLIFVNISIFGSVLLALPAGAVGTAGSYSLPFTFVENKGQSDPAIRYIGNGPQFNALFYDDGVVWRQGAATSRVQFMTGKSTPRIDALDPTAATMNYFRGSDPQRWQTDLPLFATLRYRDVWPGIEIRFGAESTGTKAEYIVAPGASLAAIRLRFDGRAAVGGDGSLTVTGEGGVLHEARPFLFQDYGASRSEVRGGYRIFEDGSVGFTAGPYDPLKPLTVDPSILFSGYFGGASQTNITAIAENSYYNVVVAGWTVASDLPASGGLQSTDRGGVDAFVAAFSPAGGALIFCTYIGGSGDDRAFGLAVDSFNNTYITGWTGSANFPLSNAVQHKLAGTRNAFVTKLNAAGNALIYSTYLGGSGVDGGNAIALDSSNGALIVGDTTSMNLPTTAGAFQSKLAGSQDAFVARLSPAGTSLTLLTYFGGSGSDHGAAIRLDASNDIVIGGSTYSPNFPVFNAFQPHSGGGQDGFVAKLSISGAPLIFSTYVGGSGGTAGAPEEVNGIAIGPSGNITAAGTTSSLNFPVTPTATQHAYGGGVTDAFVLSMNGTTGALRLATYIGGSLDDAANAVVVDNLGYAIVTGSTTSPDFPVVNPIQSSNAGGMDAFIVRSGYTTTAFATYLGGTGNDSGNAIALDSLTGIVIAGSTGSANFPVAGNAGQWNGSMLSSFVTKLAPNFTLNVVDAPTFIYDTWHNTGYNGPNLTLTSSSFGLAGDIPVMGDWDGSGVKRIGVFRNGTWYLDINGNGVFDSGVKSVAFGETGDIPLLGDWNGTGRIKLGLFRNGSFILDLSGHLSGIATGLSDATFPFGLPGDIPVAADWSQSGTTKVGVFRSGLWLVDYNGDRVFNSLDRTYIYGQAGDLPVIGDWSSTGVQNIGVYRQGIWILDYYSAFTISPTARNIVAAFGGAGYLPLVK